MTLVRKVVIAVAVFAVLSVAVVAVAWALVDSAWAERWIETRVATEIGSGDNPG